MHVNKALSVLVLMGALGATAWAADPYQSRLDRSYKSLAGSIQRAFATPSTSTPYTPYRSTVSPSSGATSSRGSDRYSGGSNNNNSSSSSESNTWALPMRQPAFGSPNGQGAPALDADGRKIAAARNQVWQLPQPPAARVDAIAAYYRQQGVAPDRAQAAAQADMDRYLQTLKRRERDAEWQAHDAKMQAVQVYQQARRATQVQFDTELAAAKQRALASNSTEDARAWWGVYASWSKRNIYYEVHLPAQAEAALFAAQRGVAEAYTGAWKKFARADPAGHEWRDKAAMVGDIEASKEAYKIYADTQPTQMATAAALFEKAFEVQSQPGGVVQPDPKHQGLGRMMAAGHLARLYARGDSSLPADTPRALEWLKKLPLPLELPVPAPVPAPPDWREWSDLVRQDLVAVVLMDNPMAAREHQDAILAYWEDLGRQAMDGKFRDWTAVRTLYGLYAGQFSAMPRAINPGKADTLWAWINPKGLNAQLQWVLMARDWRRAGLFDAITPEQVTEAAGAMRLGTLWMARNDGRADARKAVAYFERLQALEDSASPVGLADAHLAAGNPSMAWQVLGKRFHREDVRWAVSLRQAQMLYRGEAGPISTATMAQADQIIKTLRDSLKSPWRKAEVAFALQLHSESIIGPLVARHGLINAGPAPTSAEARQARAMQTRANFEAGLPALRELAFAGNAAALRLWAVVTLGGEVASTPEDTATARNTLFLDALGGDATAVSILAQRLYIDAQAARTAQPADTSTLQARFSEAADWLEASLKSGDDTARWPLATIYSEGLGRSVSQAKAREQLQLLAAAGDAEAKGLLAQWAEPPAGKRALKK